MNIELLSLNSAEKSYRRYTDKEEGISLTLHYRKLSNHKDKQERKEQSL